MRGPSPRPSPGGRGRQKNRHPHINVSAYRPALEELDLPFRRMLDAARRIAKEAPPDQSGGDLATILATEGEYLRQMERIVGLYEAEARERVDGLRKTGWAVAGLILAALIG